MRISDWIRRVLFRSLVQHGSEEARFLGEHVVHVRRAEAGGVAAAEQEAVERAPFQASHPGGRAIHVGDVVVLVVAPGQARLEAVEDRDAELQAHGVTIALAAAARSEEHTSELQSLMRISYAVFCLKKKKNQTNNY